MYPKITLLENLYPVHKFLRCVAKANLSVDNCFYSTSWRRVQCVWKMSWRCLEDVWLRRIYLSWSRCLEDFLKTSSEDVWPRWIYSSWSRRFEDVFSSVKWSDPGHFFGAPGKFSWSFLCTLFSHIFDT